MYRELAMHILTVEPDATGTTLTYGWGASQLMKMLDALFAHSDRTAEKRAGHLQARNRGPVLT